MQANTSVDVLGGWREEGSLDGMVALTQRYDGGARTPHPAINGSPVAQSTGSTKYTHPVEMQPRDIEPSET